VGRFEPQATLETVRQVFEPLPRGAVRARTSPAAPRAGERRVRAVTRTPAPMLVVGWRVPGTTDPDAPAIDLLAAAMGGGEDSRLNHALTADGRTATAGQCGVDRRRDGSMFWAAAVTPAAGDTLAAERLLLDVLGGLAREPLSGSDFDRARAQLVTSELFRAQDLHVRAGSLAEAAFDGGNPAFADERLAALARLTPEDLQRVARRILVDNARTVLWLVPEGGAR
jgi:zinc protease